MPKWRVFLQGTVWMTSYPSFKILSLLVCADVNDCTGANQVCNTVCECDTGFAEDPLGDCRPGEFTFYLSLLLTNSNKTLYLFQYVLM